MNRLRIALTISGAVSLGAYEGGALAALLIALKRLNELAGEHVVIDAVAGASAGSMTGVLAARAILTDADPVELMYQSWVVAPSLAHLRAHGRAAPLSAEEVASDARRLLGPDCPSGPGASQRSPVTLQLALGALRGLDYSFRRLNAPPLDATTYLDWYSLQFHPDDEPERYVAAIEPALASGAHAVAFPPRVLDRARDKFTYLRNGVINFPDSHHLWYTDGGTIDNQPLGRALAMTKQLDASFDGRRLHLLVIPDPTFAITSDDEAWADPQLQPLWIKTLGRAGKMAITQSLYDDLRQAEKVNSRLAWTEQLVQTLLGHVDPGAAGELEELATQLEGQRTEQLGANSRPSASPPAGDDLEAALRHVIHAATGLHAKQPIAVDAVSPRLLGAETRQQVHELLAGAFLGHFGGFLDERLRRSDFSLGYRSMLSWLADPARGLLAQGVDGAHAAQAIDAATARLDPAWTPAGGTTLSKLGLGAWLQLIGLGARAFRLALSGIRGWTRAAQTRSVRRSR